jgi:hypothetical protein
VHSSWQAYFENEQADSATPFEMPPTIGQQQVENSAISSIIAQLKASGI